MPLFSIWIEIPSSEMREQIHEYFISDNILPLKAKQRFLTA